MKLEKILDNLNSFEKNAFLKVINNLKTNRKDTKEIEKILSSSSADLKNYDSVQIAEVFFLLEDDYADYIRNEFTKVSSQLDLLIDLISRDGNSIMKQEWFSRLYEKEIKNSTTKINAFKAELKSEKPDIPVERLRDYKVYGECLRIAYHNDAANNSDLKITYDEQFSSISRQLKAYKNLIESQKEGYRVAKIQDFSDDFITDCREDCELNISLLSEPALVKILDGFKKTSRKEFPHNLFMKDVLIQEDVILKAISKWN